MPDDGWRFAMIELREPAKDVLAAGGDIERVATVLCWNRGDGQAYKAIVSLTGDRVASWEHRPGEQPNMTIDEFHEVNAAMRDEPRLVEALARRGVTDMDRVLLDTWAYGASLVPSGYGDRRVGWCDVWVRDTADSSPYANPITGLHPIVDLNTLELLELEDTGVVERAPTMGEYLPRLVPDLKLRDDLKPIEITSPRASRSRSTATCCAGSAGRCASASTRARGWSCTPSATRTTAASADRAPLSFAEMVVPYRDPTAEHERRTAFDIGEWGLGFMTTSLELGCDCLGEIAYLDAVVHDSHGEPYTIRNAICIHEEDDAILWKHVDEPRAPRSAACAGSCSRSTRRSPTTSTSSTGASTRTATSSARCARPGSWSRRSFRGRAAALRHARRRAHLRAVPPALPRRPPRPRRRRRGNTVYATDSEALPVGPDNPYGLALVQRSTPLRTEEEGMQDYDWHRQRAWKVVNDGATQRLGTPTATSSCPAARSRRCSTRRRPCSSARRSIGHTLWVTPYAEDERWPCGEFVVPERAPTPACRCGRSANRPIEDTDVVLWYVFGIHHVTRPRSGRSCRSTSSRSGSSRRVLPPQPGARRRRRRTGVIRHERPLDLRQPAEWVKSFGLPPEATDAIDRWWQPAWDRIVDALPLLPVHPARAPDADVAGPRRAGRRVGRFQAVGRGDRPARRGRRRSASCWPAYRCWYLREGDDARPDLAACRAALERHMPRVRRPWERLVELADGDELAAACLSLWRPPAFITGCSQAAWTREGSTRRSSCANYDYPASRLEGIDRLDGVDGPPRDRDDRLPLGPASTA
jgi:primary-amine oxidase